jgi:CO/xanthine dehydrogenase Mo-binding subunit
MTRSNHAAAMDAKQKLLEIAAHKFGGNPEDYDIGGHKVFSKSDPDKNLSYAEAAQRAINLGGKFSGHEVPEDIFFLTKASTAGVAGSGLIGVATDNYEKNGVVPALAAAYIKIELDLETGKFEILKYIGTTDCGTVLHPLGLETQIKGGAVQGIGLATTERMVYDPQNGLPANIGFHHAKPPTYLDVPLHMDSAAVNIADPQNPVGAKGVGEPVQGSAASALICAISDALGGHYFNRTPIVTDMIVNAAAERSQSYKPLQVNTF